MRFELVLKLIPFVLFFLFVTIPMLYLPRDMWDGTIIEYASLKYDFSGLKSYFMESNWFLQYPLSVAIIEISKILDMSYKNLNALVVFILMLIFLRETLLLAERQFRLSKLNSYFTIALVATFSTWGVLLSSIMTLHLACMAIGLLSVRMIHNKNLMPTSIGLIALVISLNLQSLLVFLPVLSFIYDLSERNQVRHSWLVKPTKQTVLIFFTCVIYFTVIRLFFPPTGLYENYNSIDISNFDELTKVAFSSLAMITFLLPIFLIVVCIYILSFIVEKKTIKSINKENIPTAKQIAWLLLLFCSGLFPYAAVGKFSTLWGIGDWGSRQAFLIVLPTCLFTVLCLQSLYNKFSSGLIKRCVLIGAAVIFLFHMMLLTIDIKHKSNRQMFVTQLEDLIQANEEKLRPGILEIIGVNLPTPQFRPYEANFLMYSATGKANWWTRIGKDEDKNFTIPCYLKEIKNYQIKFIYNYDLKHENNHTVFEIKASGFRGRLNLVQSLLGINSPGEIDLIRIYTKPVEQDLQGKNCN